MKSKAFAKGAAFQAVAVLLVLAGGNSYASALFGLIALIPFIMGAVVISTSPAHWGVKVAAFFWPLAIIGAIFLYLLATGHVD